MTGAPVGRQKHQVDITGHPRPAVCVRPHQGRRLHVAVPRSLLSHIAAATQIRLDTEGRAYYRRKLAEGKTRMEAMRCLKRRISDAVYRQLLADARRAALEVKQASGADPGGHCGASQQSSAVDLPPHIDTSDQPLPGPATPTLQPARRPRKAVALKAG